MKTIYTLIISILAVLITFSCNNKSQGNVDLPAGVNVAPDKMNKFILLGDSSEMANSHKNNETLDLQIVNLSDKSVVFPDNYGVKIFTKNEGKWTEVQNNFYNAGAINLLPTKSAYPPGLSLTVLPYIPNLSSPLQIRIIIAGNLENTNGESIGAYLDVTLKP